MRSAITRGLSSAALALAVAAGAARAAPPVFLHAATIVGDGQEVPLLFPEGIACSDDGALVIADTGNGRIVRYRYVDGQLTGGTPVAVAQAPYPTRVQIDRKGNILVLDRKAHRIARLDVAGTFTSYLDARGKSGAAAVVGAFKLDAADSAYVLDLAEKHVLVLSAEGQLTREIDLPAGAFTDLAVDPAGKIYAVEAGSASLWVADRAATSFRVLAAKMREYLNFPGYLAVSGGRLLVVDQNGHGIVTVGLDGSYQGRQLALGWNDGSLYYPAQACFSEHGFAAVADRSSSRVQIFKTGR